jgi:uncharacterized protein YjiS (DUF1127 family)
MKPMTFAFETIPPQVSANADIDRNNNTLTLLQSLRLWRHRANSRHALSQLSRRHLDDIGIDRVSADIEASKPFWRR